MAQGPKVTLVCPVCAARGKAAFHSDGPEHRHEGVAEIPRGFRYIDRGRQFGSHFICSSCNTLAREE